MPQIQGHETALHFFGGVLPGHAAPENSNDAFLSRRMGRGDCHNRSGKPNFLLVALNLLAMIRARSKSNVDASKSR